MSRHFPDWIKAYIQHTSISESPTSFHFWTAISTIAGALRRQVWIDERLYQWTPNFYIILVAPPGIVSKSTSIAQGMSLLRQVKGIAFGPNSTTWQALVKSMEESKRIFTYTAPDGKTSKEEMCAVTVAASELGSFFKPDDQAMVDVLVDIWDGKKEPWEHRTIGGSKTKIINPWLNIIACTTPTWLRNQFPDKMIGGGLTSRIVFVYGEQKRHLIAYPSRQRISSDHKETERKLVEDLQEISKMKGEFILTDDAYEWGEAWYKEHWTTVPEHMASARYQPYRARKQVFLHKLAMVLSAAQNNRLVIDASHLQTAKELVEMIEPDMIKVFESVGHVQEASQTGEIVAFLRTYTYLSQDALWGLCRNFMTLKDFESSIKAALKAKIILKARQKDTTGFILAEDKQKVTKAPDSPTKAPPRPTDDFLSKKRRAATRSH